MKDFTGLLQTAGFSFSTGVSSGNYSNTITRTATSGSSYTLRIVSTTRTMQHYPTKDYLGTGGLYPENQWSFSLDNVGTFNLDQIELTEYQYEAHSVYFVTDKGTSGNYSFTAGQNRTLSTNSAIFDDISYFQMKSTSTIAGVYANSFVMVLFDVDVSNISPLPITLLGFQARRMGENIKVDWSTANEQNNQGFEIEQSVDGETFAQVGFVEGVGNSSEQQDYTFSFRNTGATYIRFKQLDLDGQFSYSPTRFIAAWESEQEPLLFPNPFANWVSIGNIPDDTRLVVDVVDLQGRQLTILRGNKLEVEEQLSQVMENYPTGMYMIHLRTPDRSFIRKLRKDK